MTHNHLAAATAQSSRDSTHTAYKPHTHTASLFTHYISTSKTHKPLRSPLFYVGDKYKLMPQLKRLFPKNIDVHIEPFVGGGSSFLNTEAKEYWLNDNNTYLSPCISF